MITMQMLDGADGMPIGVTEARYGLRVDIIAMPAPAVWYTEEGLKRAGPTVFGYATTPSYNVQCSHR